jgi:ribosome-associated translation inhibitor RaiA
MPEGVVQWFDAAAGEATVVKAGRVYRAAVRDLDPEARSPGARVHFDIHRDAGVERAVRVTLREGTRVSRGQHRFGDLIGARRVDTKGSAPFAHPHPELGVSLASHPLEVARAWARCLERKSLDTALLFYAPDAVLHVDGREVQGRAHLHVFLEASILFGIDQDPAIRGEDGTVVLSWEHTAASPPLEVRCRIAHGLIAEQWMAELAPVAASATLPTAEGEALINIVTRGDVSDDARIYATKRLGAVVEHIREPVLFARVKLTQAADPARERPAIAQVCIDIDGDLVRAQLGGHEMHEAIDLLQARLRGKLQHRAQHQQALRRRAGTSQPGEWRHGDPPAEAPDHFDRPADERELVRHKTYFSDELTPDEAAFDMEQLDFDFYLFRDLAGGEDALLERATTSGSYRLTRLHPVEVDTGPTAVPLEVAEEPAPKLGLDAALERIGATGERFVFFENTATHRGNVIYQRYDGHYGLIAPG